jgi:hypothetical protein
VGKPKENFPWDDYARAMSKRTLSPDSGIDGAIAAAEQVPLIEMEATPLPEVAAPRQDIYLVAAFRSMAGGEGYWKIHRETSDHDFTNVDTAKMHAQTLDGCWTHRRILHCVLE